MTEEAMSEDAAMEAALKDGYEDTDSYVIQESSFRAGWHARGAHDAERIAAERIARERAEAALRQYDNYFRTPGDPFGEIIDAVLSESPS